MKRWFKRLWWLPLAGGVLYFGTTLALPGESYNVPPEFSEARIRGAGLAEEIIAASGFSVQNLATIAIYDREGNFPDALSLVAQEVLKNREIRDRALGLASALEKMAILTSEIKPARARIKATEAISAEVALVSRLITYNDLFLRLFEILRSKFQGQQVDVDGEVEKLVEQINFEARAINELNQKFTAGLAEFDSIFFGR